MTSRIEQLIDEIETYIDNCKPQPLSQTKIVVNKEEIDELLRELRSKTPEEIKKYQKIISNKEAILNDARKKAEDIVNQATIKTHELINEHEIMQQAYAQANEVVSQAAMQAKEILDNANLEANNMKTAAVQYTDQLLAGVEDIITQSIDATTKSNDEIIETIKQSSVNMVKDITASNDSVLSALAQYGEVIKSNRADLRPPEVAPIPVQEQAPVTDGGLTQQEAINLDMI
ncbi:ATPase [Butyrivibrio sp. X503]|uniref:ATPase n=1 Tax=Butyrivibrio sp. X503 TaxID=2364878 RepID=UPI000EAA91D0|nr:ATPase [Butyrivibrio sp. X503]RKM57184.1 ATPase [Butyrivibrio sp. X503]